MSFPDFTLIKTSTHQSVFIVNTLKHPAARDITFQGYAFYYISSSTKLSTTFFLVLHHSEKPCLMPTSGTNPAFAISRMNICLKISQRKGSPGKHWPVLGSPYSSVCRSALPLPKASALSPPLCYLANPRLKSSSSYLFSSTFIILNFPPCLG